MIGGMGSTELFVIFLVTFIIPVVLFLIFREVVCWYWKINHITKTLDSINEHLAKIAGRAGNTPGGDM